MLPMVGRAPRSLAATPSSLLSCRGPKFRSRFSWSLPPPPRLLEARTAATLLCRWKSWAMSYCGDLKVKKLDAVRMGFATYNWLRAGDACVFELVTGTSDEEEEVVFQVQILHGGPPEEVTTKGATADEPVIIMD